MKRRTLLIFVLLGLLVVGAVVVWALWPLDASSTRGSDLVTALVGGGIVAAAVLYFERRFAKAATKGDLRLTLGTRDEFVNFDLRGQDLSGFYLAGKDFSGAKCDGADLRGTNLSGTNLSWASFVKADLRGAKFNATMLTPSTSLYPSADLTPGAIAPGGKPLGDAKLQAITLKGAKYDSSTEWPDDFDPSAHGAVCVDEEHHWLRRLFGAYSGTHLYTLCG